MGAPSGRGATRKHIIGRTRHGHGVLETHRGERRGGALEVGKTTPRADSRPKVMMGSLPNRTDSKLTHALA